MELVLSETPRTFSKQSDAPKEEVQQRDDRTDHDTDGRDEGG